MFNFFGLKIGRKRKCVKRRKMCASRRPRRYNVPGSPCNRLKHADCRSNMSCNYTKRGCRRKRINSLNGLKDYSMMPKLDTSAGDYAIRMGGALDFGRRRVRRYNVSVSPCNRLTKKVCRSNPNCNYTKKGCRRRAGTKKGLIYEGPSFASTKRRR